MKIPFAPICACHLVAVFLLMLVGGAQANFIFTTNNGVITITGYIGAGAAVIPSVTNGYPVTTIANFAFNINSMETSVTIPDSITNIGSAAFDSNHSLTAIIVNTNNPVYASVAGVLFDKSQSTLIQYPTGNAATSYTIPNGVVSLGTTAFQVQTNLASVTIPNSVTNIGSYTFGNCSKLKGVYFEGNAPISAQNSSVFNSDNTVTVYFLPGTTGWSSTYDGRPSVLWNPQV